MTKEVNINQIHNQKGYKKKENIQLKKHKNIRLIKQIQNQK